MKSQKRRMIRPSNAPKICSSLSICEPTTARGGRCAALDRPCPGCGAHARRLRRPARRRGSAARRGWRSGRRGASSSACVPRSTIRPCSRKMISSASISEPSRCAMMIVARLAVWVRSASRMLCSVAASTAAVEFVEHQDRRREQDAARDRQALALAAGERHAALADQGLVAAWAAPRCSRAGAPSRWNGRCARARPRDCHRRCCSRSRR